MIDRYACKELEEIFSLNHRYETFLKVEIAVVNSYVKLGVIPKEDANKIQKNAKFDLNDILELEKSTHHDVVAFTRVVSQSLGEERKWIHYSLTSTDVVDTAMSLIYHEANSIIFKNLENLIEEIKIKALKYQNTPCIGRTHGIHAEITSFGLKWALFYDMLQKNKKRFLDASSSIEKIKLSGAVGNFANIPIFIQDDVAKTFKLQSSSISTQVLPRDDHAYYLSSLNLISVTLEQIALEIRLLSQTELGECQEAFAKYQKGSSAMPHKKNPISCENIMGCARMMRGFMIAGFEDVALWHERDISHSSVERVAFADAIELINYMIVRMTNVIKNLNVDENRMRKNIYLTHGVVFSQRILNALISKNINREEAYDNVQRLALISLDKEIGFYELLSHDEYILSKLSEKEIQECFQIEYYLKNVQEIYHRVGIK